MPATFSQRSAIAIAVAACFPMAGYAAGVARVDFAVGNVTAQGPDGRTRPLQRGAEIEVGDTVNTQQGRAQLRFQDGAFMSLQPETSFKVEQFRFTENGAGNDGIVMNLLKGGMRTITGLIGRANRQNYKFRTEVATIGIRGTEYAVRYTNSIEVFCAGGAIDIVNEGGTLVLGTGQGGFVQNPNQEPQRSEERPFLPPTAASGGQEPQEQIAPPVNPVQESQTATLLTGKQAYNMALSNYDTCGDFCLNAVQKLGNTAELDASGVLVAFDDPDSQGVPGTTTSGSTSVVDSKNDGIIAWGRWVNGSTAGDGFNSLRGFSGNDSFHYIVGLPTPDADMTALKNGGVTATYSFMGGTSPTTDSGDIGTLTGGSLTARFGTAQVDVDVNLAVAQSTYGVSARGLPIAGSGFSGGAATSGCGASGCSTQIQGFFAGAQAARAGLSYRIDDSGLMRTFGVVGFTRQ